MSDIDDELVLCHQEPIRTPGSIQPHGALLGFSSNELVLEIASDNIKRFIGFDKDIALGKNVKEILPATAVNRLLAALSRLKAPTPTAAFQWTTNSDGTDHYIDATVYLSGDTIVLEIDNLRPKTNSSGNEDVYEVPAVSAIQSLIMGLHQARSVPDLCHAIAEQVRELTGFDRVMVYRFHPDNHGEVVAENLSVDWHSYLGLHFPESDIPAQARELYRTNWLRCITQVPYDAVQLSSISDTDSNSPLDMSLSALRSVSPIHIEYLQNMGVGASMSISLMDNDKLWGLIACHNKTRKYVDFATRTSCELLGTTFSLLLLSLEDAEQSKIQTNLQKIERQLLNQMASSTPFVDGVFDHPPNLSDLVNAHGSSSIAGNLVRSIGRTPIDSQIVEFGQWLQANDINGVYATDSISKEYEPATDWHTDFCGVLVIEIAKSRGQYLICFRPEYIQSVNWAGNPDKAVVLEQGKRRLSPRKSFELWGEVVSKTSRPWLAIEVRSAQTLRKAALYLIIETTEEILRLNRELERSNDSLQNFAHVAAHDLKEPLRGIHNYVSFLISDHAEDLDADAKKKLDTISRLADRGNALTVSLLEYAEVGNSKKYYEVISLETVVNRALDTLQPIIDEKRVDVRKPTKWPQLLCDPLQLERVLGNLLSNAVKYSKESDQWIEVGFMKAKGQSPSQWVSEENLDQKDLVIFVRDNGIGIPAESQEDVFKLFKRLHPRHLYDGGTGMGLAIVKRIIETMNGKIWIESEVGCGSTFYFTAGDSTPSQIKDKTYLG